MRMIAGKRAGLSRGSDLSTKISRGLRVGVVIALLATASGSVMAREVDSHWQFKLTPYLWLPTIEGDFRYDPPPGGGSGGPEVSVGPVDWLELLNFGVLLNGSAAHGRLGLFTDIVYLSMSSNNDGRISGVNTVVSAQGGRVPIPIDAEANLATRSRLDGLLWSFYAGYAIVSTASSTLYLSVGTRHLNIEAHTDWELTAAITGPGGETLLERAGGVTGKSRLWDGLMGVRGNVLLGDGHWALHYSADAGTGDSNLTWQATFSAARRFGWGEIIFGYRHLDYDQGADGLLQALSFSGPGFGVSFSF